MSEGRFESTFYELDSASIAPMRVQPETLEADFSGTTNDGATGPASADLPTVSFSRSRRANGIHPRYITASWDTAPTDYDDRGVVRLAIPVKATFDAIAKGDTFTYVGGTAKVTQKYPELIR